MVEVYIDYRIIIIVDDERFVWTDDLGCDETGIVCYIPRKACYICLPRYFVGCPPVTDQKYLRSHSTTPHMYGFQPLAEDAAALVLKLVHSLFLTISASKG